MKKLINLFKIAGVMTLIFLCACSSEPETVENEIVDVDFGIENAVDMIDEVEWITAWVQTQDSVARETLDELILQIEPVMGGDSSSVVIGSVDLADWNDETIENLEVLHDFLSPTIYHEGIEVVSAVEEIYQDEEIIYSSSLEIRKEYVGEDEELSDWHLTYAFRKRRSSEEWEFVAFDGQSNIDFELQLKDSFYEKSYLNE